LDLGGSQSRQQQQQQQQLLLLLLLLPVRPGSVCAALARELAAMAVFVQSW
jgi:hypothetical protein